MKTLLLFLLTTVCFSAFAKDKYSTLIKGELTVLEPSVIQMRDGAVEVGSAVDCGLFSCKNRRFVLKNETEKAELPLPKKMDFYKLETDIIYFHYDETTKSEYLNADSTIKIQLESEMGEKKVSFEFKEYPRTCEDICTNSYESCRERDSFGRCTDPLGSQTICTETTTRCSPAYEACLQNTVAPIKLHITLKQTQSEKVLAKIESVERIYKTSEKVKMAKCFEK